MVVEKVNFTVNYDFVLSNKREKQRFIKYTFSEFCFSFGFFLGFFQYQHTTTRW